VQKTALIDWVVFALQRELDGEIAMKNTYMQNLGMTLQQYSLSAFKTHGGKSWDNRKKKGYKKYVPRGTVYQRLVSQEWKSVTRPLIELAQKWHEEYGI
jgi:hypothetical protein